MGYGARLGDDGGECGWAWNHGDVGAWCGEGQGGGAWADGGRGGHVGCGDGQASGGDWDTGSVGNTLGLCAWATFGNGQGSRLREQLVGLSKILLAISLTAGTVYTLLPKVVVVAAGQ